jgi:surfactin synthase thioesterase subunit
MPSRAIEAGGISSQIQQSSWIDGDHGNSMARARFFCFPYVGGGSSIYRGWSGDESKEVEIIPVELPGRDKRMLEEPFSRLLPLVGALAEALPRDKPFAFFGHSMGALIAFELACELHRRGSELPFCLFVSGAGAPQVPRRSPPRHVLPDDELVAELRDLGGTPEEVLQDSGMMELFLPTIRADFAIVETYQHAQSNILGCPIIVLRGDEDRETTREDALAWRLQTSSSFRLHTFHGGHFFLHSAKSAILGLISNAISSFGGPSTGGVGRY